MKPESQRRRLRKSAIVLLWTKQEGNNYANPSELRCRTLSVVKANCVKFGYALARGDWQDEVFVYQDILHTLIYIL